MKNENYTKSTTTFEPIYDKNSKILILGSHPSIVSKEKGFYYYNPQNRFWKILSKITETDFLNLSIKEKIEKLLELKIGLYDVTLSCDIVNSDDSSIKNVEVSDIDSIVKNSRITKIFLNGKTAYNLFLKHFPQYESLSIYLHSTSPANAKYNFENLLNDWSIIKDYL